MTRLITDWLKDPEEKYLIYDRKLREITGLGIPALAYRAAGIPEASVSALCLPRVAVVRFSTGEGVIGSFAESVAAVIRQMGADVFIPDESDVSGIYEALLRGAEIIFMADDSRFIAVNVKTGVVAENDYATARGYIEGLSLMAGGLSGREVLQLGYGRVGEKALEILLAEGVKVRVYDRDSDKTSGINDERAHVLSELPLPLSGLVLDLTNEGGWLRAEDISGDAKISTPGVPLSLDEEAYRAYGDRVIHDPLQLGTAVMLAMALR